MKAKLKLVERKPPKVDGRSEPRLIILHCVTLGRGESHPALLRKRRYKSLDNALRQLSLLSKLYLKPWQTLEVYHELTSKQLAWQKRKANGFFEGWCILDEEPPMKGEKK